MKQRDAKDCGPACIVCVCRFYGHNVSVPKIKQYAGTDEHGTNVLGLVQAFRKLGFNAKGIKANFDVLSEVPLPAIAHVITEEQQTHYVVIVSSGNKKIMIMDPAIGLIRRISNEVFEKMWTGILIIAEPGQEFRPSKGISNAKRFRQIALDHKKHLLFIIAGAVLASILGISTSLYLQKLVDEVLVKRDFYLLNVITLTVIFAAVAQVIIGWIKDSIAMRVGQSIDAKLVLGYYKHLLKLPQAFFDNIKPGEIISRINDAIRISAFISESLTGIIINILIIICSLVMMVIYYWKLAMIAFIAIPIYFLIAYISDRFNKNFQQNILDSLARFDSHLIESLSASMAIKSLCLENYALQKTESGFTLLLSNVYKSSLFQIYIFATTDLFTKLITIMVLYCGCYLVVHNYLTVGQLLAFYSLIAYFTNPLIHLMISSKQIRECLIAADRLFELTELEEEKSGKIIVRKCLENVKGIEFCNVHFGYSNKPKIFDGLNFKVDQGSITGIRGANGSGKSTIAALLQKLYVPMKGEIRLGQINIEQIDNVSLREMIVCVPHHARLFSETIAGNIIIGDPEPDMKKLMELGERLGINDFVAAFPNGFDTKLSAHGNYLSSGQNQRVAIARALYRSPPVLILDEATSAIDCVSEMKILETLEWYRRKGNTVILIAHQEPVLKICDTILTIANGQIV